MLPISGSSDSSSTVGSGTAGTTPRGLGDWYVDEQVWPHGLHPLVDHVHDLGMEFGLWAEPEMVNPDSDLARTHSDWILSTGGRQPPLARNHQVLDLANDDTYAYLWERLDALLSEYDSSYLKWDHNRDLVDAGHPPGGEPGVHAQILAVYRLLDELRAKHPALEIESCSSGSARVDLGILQRTDRVLGKRLQRSAGATVDPALDGAAVASRVGGSTRRTAAGTYHRTYARPVRPRGHRVVRALRHRGRPAAMSTTERAELRPRVSCYQELRRLLHNGVVVRADHPDPAMLIHGIVARDGVHALFAPVAMSTSIAAPPGRVKLPGLEPGTVYTVRPLSPGNAPRGPTRTPPPD
ncbi:MAG TPA: alpha-galactosidase [Jiangellaceae bacterium]|nr:alpha-galactosidase [Jiangellaceae bacterium]